MTRRNQWDVWISVGALALLAAWDASGWDMAAMRSLGNASGFTLRSAAALAQLHQASRVIAWAVLAWQGWMAFGPQRVGKLGNLGTSKPQPDRAYRRYWFGVTLACVLGINIIKYASNTSCPWDLAEFGGTARHVSHWMFWLADGGPGQCFPSGHSSAAFAFFTLYFVWRSYDANRARRYLLAVCTAGAILSLTQILRGAHYPSHALWSAWVCWTICCAASRWQQRPSKRVAVLPGAGQLLQLKVP